MGNQPSNNGKPPKRNNMALTAFAAAAVVGVGVYSVNRDRTPDYIENQNSNDNYSEQVRPENRLSGRIPDRDDLKPNTTETVRVIPYKTFADDVRSGKVKFVESRYNTRTKMQRLDLYYKDGRRARIDTFRDENLDELLRSENVGHDILDSIKEISYGTFMEDVRWGDVVSVESQYNTRTQERLIDIHYKNGGTSWARVPERENVAAFLEGKGVDIKEKKPLGAIPPASGNEKSSGVPWFLILGLGASFWLWFQIMKKQGHGGGRNNRPGGGGMRFGGMKSNVQMIPSSEIDVRFSDVAGAEEAKEDVVELIDFLKAPEKYQRLGGKMPTGVLMEGPPGTGKTLLAKAVAGEAGVPFFATSGSEFVEMYVGVGASRVRDMFAAARSVAPSVIFIDEIDAVGKARGSGQGSHDEREQTLNQILVEMNGMKESRAPVIVIAATNRADVLDKALTRPGRFDRRVQVPLPDIVGREQILKVHMKGKPLADDVEPTDIARGTPGMSGADLANLVNEAALCAARRDVDKIYMEDFDAAKDKIMMGAERKTMIMEEKEKKNTAYHEAGHAVLGYLMEGLDPVYKISIIPRGRALGVTVSLPEKDKFSHTRNELFAQMVMLYGGRVAEKKIGADEGDFTTGASNDIERATEIARYLAMKGMTDDLGVVNFEEDPNQSGLGIEFKSQETKREIDAVIKKLVDEAYQKAQELLHENWEGLSRVAEGLIKYETISGEEGKRLFYGEEIGRPVNEKPDIQKPGDDDDDNDPDSSGPDNSPKLTPLG